MNQDVAIEVQHISKSFKISYDKSKTLKDKIIFAKKDKYEIHQVLDDVSFTIEKGEAVGLIGHNGCGKSTTLKLLTRIIYPDSGEISIDGRVSSLLELGAGFHPDMTGRENIYTNASIFGLTKKEIDERLDEIIEFSPRFLKLQRKDSRYLLLGGVVRPSPVFFRELKKAGVAVTEKAVFVVHGVAVGLHHPVAADDSRNQHHERGLGKVKVRDHHVDHVKLITRRNKKFRVHGARADDARRNGSAFERSEAR